MNEEKQEKEDQKRRLWTALYRQLSYTYCKVLLDICWPLVSPEVVASFMGKPDGFAEVINIEPEQINAILEHAKTRSFRDYLILRLLWRSGMCVSELLALTPSDLEPYNQVLNITKAKGKKQRRVVVDPSMFAMLSKYIAETNCPEEEPIFDLSSVHVWRLCQKYGKMIGVDVHPHMFRHSYAIHLIRNGVDLRRLQQLLSHSDIQTTTVYLRFRDQDLRDVYNKVRF